MGYRFRNHYPKDNLFYIYFKGKYFRYNQKETFETPQTPKGY